MKKILAMILAVVMLSVTAFAADFNPGKKIRFNGNEDRWEGDLKAINTDNYSVSSVNGSRGGTWCPLLPSITTTRCWLLP